MKVTLQERNGRKYAYLCTSERVPGKKNPVSRKMYLGAVDPETGLIIPKEGMDDLPEDIGFSVRSHGDVLMAYDSCMRTGLCKDLSEVFGSRAYQLLAVAIAQAIHPSSSDHVYQTILDSSICRVVGLGPDLSRKAISSVINSVSVEEIHAFSRLRGSHNPGKLLITGESVPLYARSHVTIAGASHPDDNVTVMYVLDVSGAPIAVLYGVSGDYTTDLIVLADALRGNGVDCVVVGDPDTGPLMRLDSFLLRGVDFIVPCPETSEQYDDLAVDFEGLFEEENRIDCRDGVNYLREGYAGLRMLHGGYELVPDEDRGFEDCVVKLRSFANYDPTRGSAATEVLGKCLRDARARMDRDVADHPDVAVRDVDGPLSDMLCIGSGTGGRPTVKVKGDARARFVQGTGKMLVIASSSEWDEVVAARMHSRRIHGIVEEFYTGNRCIMMNTGENVNMIGQLFVEHLALMIYDGVRRALDGSGSGMSIREALRWASMRKIISTFSGDMLSSVNDQSRDVLSAFPHDAAAARSRQRT